MATDQPTDATAARLRERVEAIVHWDVMLADRDAALDTLIRYHRDQAAHEAWQMATLIATHEERKHAVRIIGERFAAAQERLAAYLPKCTCDDQLEGEARWCEAHPKPVAG